MSLCETVSERRVLRRLRAPRCLVVKKSARLIERACAFIRAASCGDGPHSSACVGRAGGSAAVGSFKSLDLHIFEAGGPDPLFGHVLANFDEIEQLEHFFHHISRIFAS